MNSESSKDGKGGPGRGQGRSRIAPPGEQAVYKLLMRQSQRDKLERLGGAAWIRSQIDAADVDVEQVVDLQTAVSLSARYIRALQQLHQFHSVLEPKGILTHMLTGLRIRPLGDLANPDDNSGLLEIIYPGGHRATVPASSYYRLALAEGVQLETMTEIEEPGLLGRMSALERRYLSLDEHLQRKHDLDR